jgi:dCMP deaminase
MDKWDKRFIEMAFMVSTWSKDPSTKVGAVITDNKNRVISLGFNGFPRGCSDSPEKYNNREVKYRRVLHAEANALLFSQRDLTGCSIYVVPMPPCPQCAGMIIQSGIARVVTPHPTEEQNRRWGDKIEESWNMFMEANVNIDMLHRYELIDLGLLKE